MKANKGTAGSMLDYEKKLIILFRAGIGGYRDETVRRKPFQKHLR